MDGPVARQSTTPRMSHGSAETVAWVRHMYADDHQHDEQEDHGHDDERYVEHDDEAQDEADVEGQDERADRWHGDDRGKARTTESNPPAHAASAYQASGSRLRCSRALTAPWGRHRCLSKNGAAGAVQSIDAISRSSTITFSTTMRWSSCLRSGDAARDRVWQREEPHPLRVERLDPVIAG